MDNVLKLANALSSEIKNSVLYKSYTKAKSELTDDLQAQINLFKRLHFESMIKDEPSTLDEEKYLAKLYFDLMRNPITKGFMESEQELLKTIATVNNILYADFPIDIKFVSD